MSYKPGDTVTIKSKRRMMQHTGKIIRMDDEEIVIRNGFETVRVDLFSWEVKKK